MKNQKISPDTISTYKTIKKMHGSWGNLNPITKRIESKKKNYEYPDSYYNDREEEIEDTIDLNEWCDW